MEKLVLNEVFEFLKQIGAVANESDFSSDWLCRSECYLRTLRFKKAEPSVGTLAICASKLSHYGNKLKVKPEHAEISVQMLSLSDECHNQIGAWSKMQWMNG